MIKPDIIFVGGCPRSGTSALSHAVAQIPGFMTGPESHILFYLLRSDRGERLNRADLSFELSAHKGSWLETNGIDRKAFLKHLSRGLLDMFQSASDGNVWVDPSPENLLVAPGLLDTFEESRFIAIIRDPVAVCRSMLMSGFPFPWAKDPKVAAQTWLTYARRLIELRQRKDERVLILRQPDMKNKPDETAGQLARFFDVDPEVEARIATFMKAKPINSSFDQSSQMPVGNEIPDDEETPERRELTAEELELVMSMCEAEAKFFGFA